MHYNSDGRLIFSPSDLVVYLESEYASWLDRWNAERNNGNSDIVNENGLPNGLQDLGLLVCEPDEEDEESRLFSEKGQEHETLFLQRLRDEGHEVEEIAVGESPDRTLEAMSNGVSFVYQGRLEHGNFAGYPDFLVRRQGKSAFGDHCYEVWDTKLARSIKASFVIQLCAYSEMLESHQEQRPEEFVVVLGTNETKRFSVQDYFHYYRSLKRSFLDFQNEFSPSGFRHPGLSRHHGRWSKFANDFLDAVDDLSRVANITQSQIRKLEKSKIFTLEDLAETATTEIPRLSQPVFERLKLQAQLQVESRQLERPRFEVKHALPDEPRRGLALLPPPSPHDVFFDIEGFPLVEDGLEYLLGVICVEEGKPKFLDWWAHDDQQERKSFQDFIDWIHNRWTSNPTMHVYHYAPYEITAMKRLMQKYAICERKVDDLLRNHVFVDLYKVVQQGLTIGTTGYSLKDIECLYMGSREGEVTTAGGSVVAYHIWMQSGESQDWKNSPLLKEIRDYNEVDCISTWKLADWLRGVQGSENVAYVPASAPDDSRRDPDTGDHPTAALAQNLIQEVNDGKVADDERKRIQELLAWLLEFHWREGKPAHWRMFARNEMTEQELIEDFDCLGGLKRTSTPRRQVKRSWVYEYQYDSVQDTKLRAGKTCFFAHDLTVTTIIETLDTNSGLVEIKFGMTKTEPPKRLCLIPKESVRPDPIPTAVCRLVESWRDGTILSQSVHDLLHRRSPRIKGHIGGSIVPQNAEILSSVVDAVSRMDQTTLCIQGPPGCGKTYTAAHCILDLLGKGKKVGVTANSHKAILNVLRTVHEAMQTCGKNFRIVKVGRTENDPLVESGDIEHVQQSKDAIDALGSEPLVMGGVAWLFSRSDLEGEFDYLFVDEAGQFSLANTVAVGLVAKNLVLVGDQMQLAQPIQGTHPGDSGQSALNYLLDGSPTIPPDLGIFLDRTWRLHPDICGFLSEAVYDGRLRSHARTAAQRVETNNGEIKKESGIVFLSVDHEGNTQGSEEEAAAIEEVIAQLIGQPVWDSEATQSRPLTVEDIMIVAPFNLQVRLLQDRLGHHIRVGSVDRFQGQEAHVIIVSMCSSTLEDSPRGADFLFDPNRLNVAVSRAKSLAIVVGTSALVSPRCSTIREMELANLFCWLVDYAEGEKVE